MVVEAESTKLVAIEKTVVPRGETFVAEKIASGYDETCAIKSGQVWCWGERHERILSDPKRYRRHPELVPGIENAVEIADGFGFMCARLSSGNIRCWGENSMMELGSNAFL